MEIMAAEYAGHSETNTRLHTDGRVGRWYDCRIALNRCVGDGWNKKLTSGCKGWELLATAVEGDQGSVIGCCTAGRKKTWRNAQNADCLLCRNSRYSPSLHISVYTSCNCSLGRRNWNMSLTMCQYEFMIKHSSRLESVTCVCRVSGNLSFSTCVVFLVLLFLTRTTCPRRLNIFQTRYCKTWLNWATGGNEILN